ncbi:MAG TPA: PilN domain-containing protein, partial [Acetobacteraceae bacterium]|nr:PilN domain-containing protein [Acetobacteraceae bacterium]
TLNNVLMLGALLSWWIEQMRDLVAPLGQRASTRSKDALVLAYDGQGSCRIARRHNGKSTHLATLAADATEAAWRHAFASRRRREPVVVTLDQPFLVRRTTFPLVAAADLDQLLHYEMDRLTPFAAADVLYSHRIVARDTAAGTLAVDIAVVPKAWVRDPLQRLAALSIRPEALEASTGEFPTDLTPSGEWPARPGSSNANRAITRILLDHDDPAHRARVRLGWRAAIGTSMALAAAVVAVPLIRQSLALADVDARIAALRPHMDQVDALRRQIAAGSAGAGQIAAARERGTVALRALGILTDLMPDDTYLTSVALRHNQLTIEGHSTAATKLIAAMTADPQLKNPAFGAPVVRAENGTDIFTIQAGFGS